MNKQFTNGQQALQGNVSNGMSFPDQTNNGQNNLFINLKTKFMNKKMFFAVIVLFANFLFLTGCQQEEIIQPVLENQSSIPGDQLSKAQALKEIKPVVQEFLNAQYEYYIDKDKNPRWFNYMERGAAQTLQQQIDEGRENLYFSMQYKPLSYTSELEITNGTSIEFIDNTWVLKNVYDKATLTETYQGRSPIGTDTSTFSVQYKEVILKKINNQWVIVSWKENGILNAMPHRWFRSKEKNELKDTVNSNNLQTTNAAITVTYNRTAAVMYAINNVFTPSSNYPDYSVAPYNGDCTNFVSQCLEAGGWAQISSGTNKWFHKKGSTTIPSTTYRSPSWTGTNQFKTFLVNSTRVSSSTALLADLNIGDVVQLVSSGSAYHTTIVTKKEVIDNTVVIKVHYRSGGDIAPDTYVNMNYFSNSSRKQYKLKNSYGLA